MNKAEFFICFGYFCYCISFYERISEVGLIGTDAKLLEIKLYEA